MFTLYNSESSEFAPSKKTRSDIPPATIIDFMGYEPATHCAQTKYSMTKPQLFPIMYSNDPTYNQTVTDNETNPSLYPLNEWTKHWLRYALNIQLQL